MKQTRFPPGWDEDRVRRVLAHYERQTEEEAVAAAIEISVQEEDIKSSRWRISASSFFPFYSLPYSTQ